MLEKVVEWSVYAMLVAFTLFLTNTISEQYNIWGFMHWAGSLIQ